MEIMRALLFITTILLLISCSKKTTTTNSELFDSTFVQETVRLDTVFIAGDTVRLTELIECDSVTNKPKPFKVSGKSGRASVKVSVKKNGQLSVIAICDSLKEVIQVMDKEIFRLRQEKKVITTTLQPSKFKVWFDTTCKILAGIFILLILFFVLRKFLPF
jgi:hypothetical protein